MAKYRLIPPVRSIDNTDEILTTLDELVLRANSTCQAKISGGGSPSITYGENVESASQSATGIYVVTLSVTYADADNFVTIVTPVDSTPHDLKATITATTASTVTVQITDSADTDTDPEHFMIYTYGAQA